MTHAKQTLGPEPGSFPFESRFCRVGGAQVHYLDEGHGNSVVFMVHGSLTWSFFHSHVISAFRPGHRCMAIDLPRFGLSEPPDGFGFHPEDRAAVMAVLQAELGIEDTATIAHDWGGPVGLSASSVEPGRRARFLLGNPGRGP